MSRAPHAVAGPTPRAVRRLNGANAGRTGSLRLVAICVSPGARHESDLPDLVRVGDNDVCVEQLCVDIQVLRAVEIEDERVRVDGQPDHAGDKRACRLVPLEHADVAGEG